jgi:hypothetical protein
VKRPSKKKLATSPPSGYKSRCGNANTAWREHHDGFDTIFKPRYGERRYLRSADVLSPQVRFYKREVLAYEMDLLFGFGIVPVTVIAGQGKKIGSRQLWVDGRSGRPGAAQTEDPIGVAKIIVFDIICGNTDRHDGNFIYDDKRKKVWAIDNGLCFPLDISDLSCTFLPYSVKIDIINGDMKSSSRYFQELPRSLQDRMRSITRRRFMSRFKKYKLEEEGKLAWKRMQGMMAA